MNPSAAALLEAASVSETTLLDELGTSLEGLLDREAEERLEIHGTNTVAHEVKKGAAVRLLEHFFTNPINVLLSGLAGISLLMGDSEAAIIIGIMVVLAVLLSFIQESRSSNAAEKLREMVSTTATVVRKDKVLGVDEEAVRRFEVRLHPHGPQRKELPIAELVPGDIVLLSAGDMIPADVRILSCKDLFVSQAAMTGESLPVEKFADNRHGNSRNVVDFDNIAFMGTNVVSGTARAVVVTTGSRTLFGALAARVTATDRAPTAFQESVNRVSWLMLRFMLVMTPIVLLINGFTKGDWLEAFLFALSIAIGLTPEMLPMIVTTTLAKGAVFLSRKKVIVKRLDAIQNFGAMDVLCTDKTGTLTQDRIFLERHTDAFGQESEQVLEYAYLNSYYQTGLKNLLDVAVLDHGDVHAELEIAADFRKVDEVPFDFGRRRMSVVVSAHDDHHLLICKGAVDEILAVCNSVQHEEQTQPLTPDVLAGLRSVTTALNEEGLRIVAVAAKVLPAKQHNYGIADESELTLMGYIAFLDPPKESAAPALEALQQHGVAVKVLTGDNELVTAKICREVGLLMNHVVLGSELEAMGDAELARTIERANVFARLTPAHKERIVRALRKNGHIVGFLGDGINDAAALRAADIGISVDTAVDIAKEAADIILLEKSLMVLEQGVLEGRRTFVNMLKYIKMAASSNFGNVFSVLLASAFLPFLPMLPLQLLVQNLLYDISQIAIPFDNVDAEQISAPQRWRAEDLGRFMIFFGPISSIFDVTTYCVMWFVFDANVPERQGLFQSAWFVEGLLSQTLVVHMIRTEKIAFVQSRPGGALLTMTTFVMAIGIFLPMSGFAHYFKLQALPGQFFPWLLAILLGYMLLAQVAKGLYAKRYGWQ